MSSCVPPVRKCTKVNVYLISHVILSIGRASLARENEAGGSWGQEVYILHVNI